jgi:hypothetical protein
MLICIVKVINWWSETDNYSNKYQNTVFSRLIEMINETTIVLNYSSKHIEMFMNSIAYWKSDLVKILFLNIIL